MYLFFIEHVWGDIIKATISLNIFFFVRTGMIYSKFYSTMIWGVLGLRAEYI